MTQQKNRYILIDGTPLEDSHSLAARLLRPWILAAAVVGGAAGYALDNRPATESPSPLERAFLLSAIGVALVGQRRTLCGRINPDLQRSHVVDTSPRRKTSETSLESFMQFSNLTITKLVPSAGLIGLGMGLAPAATISVLAPLTLETISDLYRYAQVGRKKWALISSDDMEEEAPVATPAPQAF